MAIYPQYPRGRFIMTDYVRWLRDLRMDDVPIVGGKNASLGEMIHHLAEVGV